MKKRHLALGLLLCTSAVHSQDILWEKSYGGRHAEYLSDLQPTADYGFIMGGSSLSAKSGNKTEVGSGDLDYWICKMDEHGSAEWQKSFGGGASDLLQSIRTTHDGGFLLAGTSNSPVGLQKTAKGYGGNDYWVIKLDAKGNELWQKCYGGIGQDDLQGVVVTRDGGYLLAGSSNSSIPLSGHPANGGESKPGEKKESSRGNMDFWVIKIDADGNEEWQRTYGGEYADLLRSAVATNDGGFLLGGYSNSGQSGEKEQENFGVGGDYWIIKIDGKGNQLWQQTLGGSHDDQLSVVCATYDGGLIAAGHSSSSATGVKKATNQEGSDFWILKLDATGNIDWQQTYHFGSIDVLTSVVENNDHTLLVGGYSAIASNGKREEGIGDYIALKLSERGEVIWDRTVGSSGEDILKKVIETRDGGYVMAGTSNPESQGHIKKKHRFASGLNPFDSSKKLAAAERLQNKMDGAVNEASEYVNGAVKEGVHDVLDAVNGQDNPDSNLKFGLNGPGGTLLNPTRSDNNAGSGNSGQDRGVKQDIGTSGEKGSSYGNKDFWIVKLKDRQKKEEKRKPIEAIPNPARSYTNVIVGFDFETGTARLYDIGGRELQRFAIESRTIPVNLSGYPMGVYIVHIETNKGEASVKVVKNE